MKKKHIGSKLDDLLQADRLLETTTATATKRVIAHQIAQEMKRRRLTKVARRRECEQAGRPSIGCSIRTTLP